MNMTFKEKSTWLSLFATLVIFGDYAISLFSMDASVLSNEDMVDMALSYLGSAILYIIIIEVIFQSLIAASSRNKMDLEGDERDRLITLLANNSGYWVLSIGVILSIGQLILPHVLGIESLVEERITIPLFEIHLLLFSLILAEIVRFSHQVCLYRKDAM